MLQACKGHCTFDSGLCSFENTEDENSDDFDWKVVSNMNKITIYNQRDIYSVSKTVCLYVCVIYDRISSYSIIVGPCI